MLARVARVFCDLGVLARLREATSEDALYTLLRDELS